MQREGQVVDAHVAVLASVRLPARFIPLLLQAVSQNVWSQATGATMVDANAHGSNEQEQGNPPVGTPHMRAEEQCAVERGVTEEAEEVI